MIALGTALVWPRVGQAAEVMPLGDKGLSDVLRWVDDMDAEIIELDSASGRIEVRVSSNFSLLTALGSGILLNAAPKSGCDPEVEQEGSDLST